jgi:uncharacterized protein
MKSQSRRSFFRRLLAGTGLAALPSFGRAQTTSAQISGAYTILSFCGGGIRGLASATMLNELYLQFPNVVARANMLAGTSTGAGIVAALATGQTPLDIINNFVTNERDFYKYGGQFTNPAAPAYSVATFASNAHKTYPDQTLASITGHNVLLTSFNVGDAATPWQPVLFHNFPGSPNADTLLADAVVSSGAMPGMFGSYQFGTYTQGNVDGAFVNHDPTLAAIALAVNAGVGLNNIVVICFGTGFMENYLGTATGHWGAHQWQHGDLDLRYKVPPLLINGTPCPILNISLNGTSTNLIPELAAMLLPERYAYLNPILDQYIPENESNGAKLLYLQNAAANVDLSAAEALLANYWH